MGFAKKMAGFPSDLVSFSNQTKLPSKDMRKYVSHFLHGPVVFGSSILLQKVIFTGISNPKKTLKRSMDSVFGVLWKDYFKQIHGCICTVYIIF